MLARELVELFRRNRSPETCALLAARHGQMVFRTCFRRLGNLHDAEDATQAVFLTFMQRPDRVIGRNTIEALQAGFIFGFVGQSEAIITRMRAEMKQEAPVVATGGLAEVIDLFEWARARKGHETFELYRWFLPLLRMDTVPKFVQLIKLVQEELGVGSARVRAPRGQLAGAELESAREAVRAAMAARPRAARASTRLVAG